MEKLTGVTTALITPFTSDGRLDVMGLRKNIQFQLNHHIDGLLVLGTTGEPASLSPDERQQILDVIAEDTKGQTHIMVGTGSNSTRTTIEQTRAVEAFADSVLVVTPYYIKPTQEGIYQHFKAVADATNIPIIIYNIPGRTGVNIEMNTLIRLAAIPNIIGIKEASGDFFQMLDVFMNLRDKLSVLCGDDIAAFPFVQSGGPGIISVLSNLFPDVIKQLASGQGDKDLFLKYYPIIKAAFVENNPIGIKAMMQQSGMPAGQCRLPLTPITPEGQRVIERALESQQIGAL